MNEIERRLLQVAEKLEERYATLETRWKSALDELNNGLARLEQRQTQLEAEHDALVNSLAELASTFDAYAIRRG